MVEEHENQESPDDPHQPAPTRGGGRGMMIAFVAVVVLLETGMFFFLVPSADEVSALAEAKLIKSVQEGEAAAEQKTSDENAVKEFNLGMYGETFSPIDTERSYRVEIDLYGLTRKKNKKKMEAEFTEKEGRLRHAIRMKIRNSELSELNDNNLGLLERRILTTCNHLLEDDLLLGVGFRSYQLIEQ
jgi:flagellar basal body-associated protein FliL